MDVGNGWRPAQGCPQDKTVINRIMLRFRPIAPKPPADTSTPASASKHGKPDLVTERPRSKRKYVRVKKITRRSSIRTQNIGNSNDRTAEEEGKRRNDETVLTLQLLPENSSNNNGSFLRDSPDKGCLEKPFLMDFDNLQDMQLDAGWTNQTDRSSRMVESWVMVDGMSDTWVDGGELGYTDTDKMKNLEKDSCPGLISDALNRVQWVNPAYRKMVDPWYDVGGGAAAAPPEMVVRLLMKENVGALLPAAFACTVRVVYWWQKAKQSQTMPCDVWKMEFGGFAWRLDAKAALCLGRSSSQIL